MTDPNDTRLMLAKGLLDGFQAEYDDAVDTWRALEGKAQVTITVGGVFLAAMFAFVRDIATMGSLARALLGIAVVILVAAVVMGLLVFTVVLHKAPPLGTFTESGVFDIVNKADADLSSYFTRFVQDQATQWREAIESISAVNDKKAIAVWRAQVALVVAIVVTAAFTIVRLATV